IKVISSARYQPALANAAPSCASDAITRTFNGSPGTPLRRKLVSGSGSWSAAEMRRPSRLTLRRRCPTRMMRITNSTSNVRISASAILIAIITGVGYPCNWLGKSMGSVNAKSTLAPIESLLFQANDLAMDVEDIVQARRSLEKEQIHTNFGDCWRFTRFAVAAASPADRVPAGGARLAGRPLAPHATARRPRRSAGAA